MNRTETDSFGLGLERKGTEVMGGLGYGFRIKTGGDGSGPSPRFNLNHDRA